MLIPHLHFCDDCEEAIVFLSYPQTFGKQYDVIKKNLDLLPGGDDSECRL